jgi:S4 domain protein YaaA
MKTFDIRDEYITLGQLLKAADVIDTGGQAKALLAEGDVLVNGEKETRRGRKLYPGDTVQVRGFDTIKVGKRS